MSTGLTQTQRRVLSAIEQGHTTTRAIAAAAGLSSNATVAHHLQRLALYGHVILEETPHGLQAFSGADFAAGWNLAARLAGNEEA